MGWSGARWILTSSRIDRVMNNECSGINLQCPYGKLEASNLMSMFVDDSAQLCNTFKEPNTTILEQTTSNLQLYSDLVYTTGGKLAHDKCKFYYVNFFFDENDNAKMCSKQDLPTALLVVDAESNEAVSIKHLDVSDPHKTLGYYLSPAGCQEALYDVLYHFASKWASSVHGSHLTPNEINLSYHTVLLPQLTYRLAASSLSYIQCDNIMKIIYPRLLNTHGLPRSFPRHIASAPYTCVGLNIIHLYDLQGRENIKFLTLHTKRMDTTGKLMTIHMKCIQLIIGTKHPFQTLNFTQYSQLISHSWLKYIWEYLDK